jgi:mono/diheme cytochrome c family protein
MGVFDYCRDSLMNLKSTPVRLVLLAVVAAAAVGAWLALTAKDVVNPEGLVIDPADAALVAMGKEVYGRTCVACHGADLRGQPNWRTRGPDGLLPAPPHDESGHTWHHADDQLFVLMREGIAALAPAGYRTSMPAYKGVLSDREIVAVLAYIKSTWPAHIRAQQADITRRANGR